MKSLMFRRSDLGGMPLIIARDYSEPFFMKDKVGEESGYTHAIAQFVIFSKILEANEVLERNTGS
jgi:hypothetical protein